MTSHPALPPEIRLRIYEICLAEYFDTPGVCFLPTQLSFNRSPGSSLDWSEIQGAVIKTPVPPILQIELGEMRSHLLAWLARYRGVFPVEHSPVLRFPDRQYRPQSDILFLRDFSDIEFFCRLMMLVNVEMNESTRMRRVAVAAYNDCKCGVHICQHYTFSLDTLCEDLQYLDCFEELFVVIGILKHGELVSIRSVPKGNHSAYSIEPLHEDDLKGRPDRVKGEILGIDKTVRPLLEEVLRDAKITACKMVPRP